MSPERSSTGTEPRPSQPWWADRSESELLSLAKEYPYPGVTGSYLFVRGRAYELLEWTRDPLLDGRVRLEDDSMATVDALLAALGIGVVPPLPERTPVLAYGSNAAPAQLGRKFGHLPDAVIPVLQADVSGIDVVYSAHITRYGAIPATLAASPGTVLHAAMTWLTADQLAVMHESEIGRAGAVPGNYTYGELPASAVSSVAATGNERVGTYISRFGALGVQEAPLALAAVLASERAFATRAKLDILQAVRDLIAPDHGVDAFILMAIRDDDLRRSWSEHLRAAAHPLTLPGFAEQARGDRDTR